MFCKTLKPHNKFENRIKRVYQMLKLINAVGFQICYHFDIIFQKIWDSGNKRLENVLKAVRKHLVSLSVNKYITE